MHSISTPLGPLGEGDVAGLRLLVVDDQAAVRHGVSKLIAASGIAVCRVVTAATATEALALAVVLRPHVVVLDADLDGEDGLALVSVLSRKAGVLVLTSHADAATRTRARLLGALAFVLKHQPASELLAAVARLAALQPRGEEPPGQPGSRSHAEVVGSSAVQGLPNP